MIITLGIRRDINKVGDILFGAKTEFSMCFLLLQGKNVKLKIAMEFEDCI